MEPGGEQRVEPGLSQADLKQLQTRHEKFRSSFFSHPRGPDKPNVFARHFTAATAALGAASSLDSSLEDATEGRVLDSEALRDAMAVDAAGARGETDGSQSSSGAPGGDGGDGDGGDDETGGGEEADDEGGDDEGGEGGDGEEGDGGGGDGAGNPYKGKHWSSAAASCVLPGYPPSPRAAAAVAAHVGAREAGLANGGLAPGIGRKGGGDSCSDGHVLSSSSGGGSVSADGASVCAHAAPAAAAAAAAPAVAPAAAPPADSMAGKVAAGAAVAAAGGDTPNMGPRPRTIWERGGGAPTPKKEWRKLIDSPKRTVSEAAREAQRRRDEAAGRGRGAGGSGGGGEPSGEDAAEQDDTACPGRVKPAFMQWRRRTTLCGGRCPCCRPASSGGGEAGPSSGSNGGGRNTSWLQVARGGFFGRKRMSSRSGCSSSSSSGGGDGPSGGGDNGEDRPNLRTSVAGGRKRKAGDGGRGGSPGGRPSGIRVWTTLLAIGLALEVAATAWAFQRAVEAGALDKDPDCSSDGALYRRHASQTVQEECEEEEKEEEGETADLDDGSSFVPGEGYAFCDPPVETRKGEGFLDLCSCESEEPVLPASCLMVSLSSSLDDCDACYARAVDPEDGYALVPASSASYSCWVTSPTRAEALAVTSFVMALGGQAAEAAVAVLCLRDPWPRGASGLMPTVAVVFQALGALATATVLASEAGGFGSDGDGDPLLSALAVTVAVVIAGVFMEGVTELSGRVRRALPYLSALGNALLWLGVAALEILVVAYFVWQAAGDGDLRSWDILADEITGLLLVEALALLALWAARVLWTRAKLLTAVEWREGPARRRSSRFRRFDNV